MTVRVVDAGDPVAGAAVRGLPGGTQRTAANGKIVVLVPSGAGALSLTATKPGYVAAKGRVTI